MTAPTFQSARAVADLTEGTILAAVEIAASPDRVFRAISSAEIATWWGSPSTYRVTQWTGDVRPGGWWRSEGVSADGTSFAVTGEILEVDPPRLLVQTWRDDHRSISDRVDPGRMQAHGASRRIHRSHLMCQSRPRLGDCPLLACRLLDEIMGVAVGPLHGHCTATARSPSHPVHD
jgi:uncharacterized protein YndB with AHSA1/START domain